LTDGKITYYFDIENNELVILLQFCNNQANLFLDKKTKKKYTNMDTET